MINRVYSMLGIGRKAGKAFGGEFKTEECVKGGKAHLVIIAEDASENTTKKFKNMCTYYEVPCYVYGTKEEIGHAIGLEFRASVVVTDAGIAAKIADYLKCGGNLNGKNESP